MTLNFNLKDYGIGRVALLLVLMIVSGSPLFADLPYPVTDTFETDPATEGWVFGSDANGTAGWDATEGISGTHSIKLSHAGGGWTNVPTEIAYVRMTTGTVPQTGFVEVSFQVKYTALEDPTNHQYLISFGDIQANPLPAGIGDILVVGINGANKTLTVADGDGVWVPLSYQMPQNNWVKIRVVFNQDARTYDLFVQPNAGVETHVRTNKPLISQATNPNAKFGDGGAGAGSPGTHNDIVFAANPDPCTCFIDDFTVKAGTGSGGPVPTPTPLPFAYPGTDSFESNPFNGAVGGRWKISGDGITTSTVQHLSGSTSVKIVGQSADPTYSDSPRLVADLQGVPQTGKVEVKLATFFESLDLHNACQFLNFGSQITQGDGYHIITVGYLTGNTTLRVYDSLGWDTPATSIDLTTNTWYHHRIVFDQDAKTYSYFIQVGSDPEVEYIHDELTRDTKLGEAPYTFFSSIPFTTTTYYVDDFSINEPGAQPPVNRVGDSWELY